MRKPLTLFLVALAFFILPFLGGCSEERERTVDQVKVLQGADQCALPGKEFSKTLRLELLGPRVPGMLGGKGSRAPVSGVRVQFVPLEGSDLVVTPAVLESDPGGMVQVKITAGKSSGDQFLKIIPEGFEEKAVTVRLVSGMEITGADGEYRTGSDGNKVAVRLVRNEAPAEGVPVRFRMLATAEGAATTANIETPQALTDAEGVAETAVRLGGKSGVYQVGIEVSDPDTGFFVANRSIRLLGFDLWAVILTVLGGLTLFVLGMKLMADGIQKVAGENMKKILQFFARNGIVAVLAGTLATAVIQSSSATTVMVIGFINAGLLNLSQAVGIIFGANIGTTVTAQIISFNLTGLAMPAIILGFAVTLSKRRGINGWGEAILGFGLLFFGMAMMGDELKMLGDFPSFKRVFALFDCTPAALGGLMPPLAVLGALAIGMVATMVIQSSSAAMGIVLALAGSGLVNFYTAVPLLVGTNIGTTVTALLAAAAANRVAKQAALAHTLFNVFGALLMVVLFYVPWGDTPVFLHFINEITPGDVFAAVPQNIERHIAMAHTFFNVVVVLVLLPFINPFARLCAWVLPIPADEKVKFNILEPSLITTPTVALKQTVSAIRMMVKDSWRMVDEAFNKFFLPGKTDEERFAALAEAEERIDQLQAEVTQYLVRITRQPLSEPQSELVPLLMHCTNDAERIADHTEGILKLAERLAKSDKRLSGEARKDLKKLWETLDDQARNVIDALGSDNPEMVKFALKDERRIGKWAERFESGHIERLRKGTCVPVNGIIFVEILNELVKIGDRLSNIAERTPVLQQHYIKLKSGKK